MELTQNFVKAKLPCADGYKWFLRHRHKGSDYQRLLDALVDTRPLNLVSGAWVPA